MEKRVYVVGNQIRVPYDADVLLPDTPIDLRRVEEDELYGRWMQFFGNLKNGRVEINERTYNKITTTVGDLLKAVRPSLTFRFLPYEIVREFGFYYTNFKGAFIEMVEERRPQRILFLGRSTKPLIGYLYLQGVLVDLYNNGIELVYLTSRNEKRGGLRERLIKEYLQSLNGNRLAVVDDVSNTGRTLMNVKRMTGSKNLPACVGLVNLTTLERVSNRKMSKYSTNSEYRDPSSRKVVFDGIVIHYGTGVYTGGSVNTFTHFYGDGQEIIGRGIKALSKKRRRTFEDLVKEFPLTTMFSLPIETILSYGALKYMKVVPRRF